MRIEWTDALRFSSTARHLLSRRAARQSEACDGIGRIDLLCKAIRLSSDDLWAAALENRLRNAIADARPSAADVAGLHDHGGDLVIRKAVVLKPWISNREKGVLLISFEQELAKLLLCPNLHSFVDQYQLVVAPSWSPPHTPFTCLFPHIYPGEIVTLVSNPRDTEFFPSISPKYLPVELFASNWVDPDSCTPKPFVDRDIDLLMVANWGGFKRHFALFKALADMPEGLRVVCVGQPDGGRTIEDIRAEAELYGVAGRVELLESLVHWSVMELFSRAKASVVLSKREGSCVAVAESILADAPVAILEDAWIGSKAFINEQTGCLLGKEHLPDELYQFIQAAQDYSPRKWALNNQISCHGSTEKLNRFLKERSTETGEEWTQDIFTHCWRPDPQILDLEKVEVAGAEIIRIRKLFGISLEAM